MKYWIETLIELPVRRGDKYEWSMFRNPDTLGNRIIAADLEVVVTTDWHE